MVTKEHLHANGVNYVTASRLFTCYDVQPFAVQVNGHVLVRARSRDEANAMATGAEIMLIAMGYETRIRFCE